MEGQGTAERTRETHMPQQQNRAVTTSVLASLWQGGISVSAGLHRLAVAPRKRQPASTRVVRAQALGSPPLLSARSPWLLSKQLPGTAYAHGLRLGAAQLLADAVGAKQEGDQDGPPHKGAQPPPASLAGNDASHGTVWVCVTGVETALGRGYAKAGTWLVEAGPSATKPSASRAPGRWRDG